MPTEEQPIQRGNLASDPVKSEKLLYHYTDQKGLLGILNSKSIWATHVRYLNDAAEFIHGINIARQCVKEMRIDMDSALKIIPNETSRLRVSKRLWEIFSELIDSMLGSSDKVPIFVTSFFDSEEHNHIAESQDIGDSLGQWRAYSKGSSGFSIGFDKTSLENYINMRKNAPSDKLLFCEGCSYDQEKQRDEQRAKASELGPIILESIKELAEKLNKDRNFVTRAITMEEDWNRRLRKSIGGSVVEMALPAVFMKHPAFRDEREWRIAKMIIPEYKEQVCFRPGKSSLVPYINIPLPISHDSGTALIRRIVIGPSPEMGNAIAAVEILLTTLGYKVRTTGDAEGIEVLSSKIPYRDW